MRLGSSHIRLVTAVVLVGCADTGDEGMIVVNNTAVTGDSCSLTGDPGQPFIPRGAINTEATIGYVFTPLIRSRVAASTAGMMGMTGPVDELQRTIFLRSADVQLTVKATTIEQGGVYSVNATERALPAFSTLFSGSLPPSGSVNVAFEVIPPSLLRQIKSDSGVNTAAGQTLTAEVLAEVTIRGEMGGDEVVAQPFHYPISVCTDCVVIPACEAAMQNVNPCNPFQDGTYCLSIINP